MRILFCSTLAVGLSGCAHHVTVDDFILSWYGASPTPSGIQSILLDSEDDDYFGEGCRRDIAASQVQIIEGQIQKGIQTNATSGRIDDLGHIAVIKSEQEFIGMIGMGIGQDLSGRTYKLTDEQAIQFFIVALEIVVSLGCIDAEYEKMALQDYLLMYRNDVTRRD